MLCSASNRFMVSMYVSVVSTILEQDLAVFPVFKVFFSYY